MRAIAALLSLWLVAGAASAQEVQLKLPPGPHYAGDRIALRLHATGFDEDPTPAVEVPPPERGRLESLGVSPNVSSQITIVNGRVTQLREVRFVYDYRYLASEPGEVVIGPFRVTQRSVVRTAGAVRLNVNPVPLSEEVRVELRLPERAIYVGERVPVTLEFWLERELQKNLESYALSVPLFDLSESFRFLDPEEPPGDTEVAVETASGPLKLRGALREVTSGRRRYLVVSVPRTLVPLRAGDHAIPPSTLLVSEGTAWRRDFFSGRRATRVRKLRAADRARNLVVSALPIGGAPPSFAGAVGRGFTLEVAANRTVVQAGEPITLAISLRGEGLETAGLPPLGAEGLLPPSQFRVPEGDVPGVLEEDGAKRFTAVVRVLDDRVREIPALEYAWFDPATGSFETTRSRPIALSVRAAEVIGAADVVSDAEEGPAAPRHGPTGGRAEAAEPAPRARSFALTGADLAIERDPAVLLRDPASAWGGAWLSVGLYAGSSLVVLLALFDRRRRDVDPEVVRRHKLVRVEQRRIRDAAALSAREGAEALAGALRRMLAEVPDARSPELDAFLGECDARSYAPEDAEGSAGSGGLDPALCARALELASRIAERFG